MASSPESAQSTAQTAELAGQRARERSLGLASLFRQTAQTLDHSADLAEAHALRHERHGRHGAAGEERRVAERARAAAAQARAHADQWLSAR